MKEERAHRLTQAAMKRTKACKCIVNITQVSEFQASTQRDARVLPNDVCLCACVMRGLGSVLILIHFKCDPDNLQINFKIACVALKKMI